MRTARLCFAVTMNMARRLLPPSSYQQLNIFSRISNFQEAKTEKSFCCTLMTARAESTECGKFLRKTNNNVLQIEEHVGYDRGRNLRGYITFPCHLWPTRGGITDFIYNKRSILDIVLKGKFQKVFPCYFVKLPVY